MSSSTLQIWKDENGFVASIELILVSTIAVIGLLAGTVAVRDGLISELSDVAGGIQDLNQSYTYFGLVGHAASNAGSDYVDRTDFCDEPEDVAGAVDNCILIALPPGVTPGGGGGGPGFAGG